MKKIRIFVALLMLTLAFSLSTAFAAGSTEINTLKLGDTGIKGVLVDIEQRVNGDRITYVYTWEDRSVSLFDSSSGVISVTRDFDEYYVGGDHMWGISIEAEFRFDAKENKVCSPHHIGTYTYRDDPSDYSYLGCYSKGCGTPEAQVIAHFTREGVYGPTDYDEWIRCTSDGILSYSK